MLAALAALCVCLRKRDVELHMSGTASNWIPFGYAEVAGDAVHFTDANGAPGFNVLPVDFVNNIAKLGDGRYAILARIGVEGAFKVKIRFASASKPVNGPLNGPIRKPTLPRRFRVFQFYCAAVIICAIGVYAVVNYFVPPVRGNGSIFAYFIEKQRYDLAAAKIHKDLIEACLVCIVFAVCVVYECVRVIFAFCVIREYVRLTLRRRRAATGSSE